MYFFSMQHLTNKPNLKKNGKVVRAPTAKNRFHYITRTAHYRYQKNDIEIVEFVRSGNLPSWATKDPSRFWEAADFYERSGGRTATTLVIALPKELSVEQRIELTEQFIDHFANRYQFPYACAIHNHAGSLQGMEQPHLHFMYSERSLADDIERRAEQFFKRYNAKHPEKGGAQKLTADVLGLGKAQVGVYRQETENLLNASLQRHAPTKKIVIQGLQVEVPNAVSCLSHQDYNRLYGTQLQDVPMIPKKILNGKSDEILKQRAEMVEQIRMLREHNNLELYRPYYEAALAKQLSEASNTMNQPRRNEPPNFRL